MKAQVRFILFCMMSSIFASAYPTWFVLPSDDPKNTWAYNIALTESIAKTVFLAVGALVLLKSLGFFAPQEPVYGDEDSGELF